MKRINLIVGLLASSLVANATGNNPENIDDCEDVISMGSTNINGVDTSEWLHISGILPGEGTTEAGGNHPDPFGFGCKMLLSVTSDASQGDYVYALDFIDPQGFSNSHKDPVSYEFLMDLSGVVSSYQEGNQLVIFQVRSTNPTEKRLMNLSLIRTRVPSSTNPYSEWEDGWKMKIAFFKPNTNPASDGAKKFIRHVEWYDLGTQPDRTVYVRYEWDGQGSRVILDGAAIENPLLLDPNPENRPETTKLGYNYTISPLKAGDELYFEGVLPRD